MNKEKEELEEEEEEEEDYTLDDLERDLRKEMKKYSKLSPEYRTLMQRLTEVTEAKRNLEQAAAAKTQRWNWLGNLVGNALGNMAVSAVQFGMNRKTVNDVLKHEEDGYILTTKSQNFIKKP